MAEKPNDSTLAILARHMRRDAVITAICRRARPPALIGFGAFCLGVSVVCRIWPSSRHFLTPYVNVVFAGLMIVTVWSMIRPLMVNRSVRRLASAADVALLGPLSDGLWAADAEHRRIIGRALAAILPSVPPGGAPPLTANQAAAMCELLTSGDGRVVTALLSRTDLIDAKACLPFVEQLADRKHAGYRSDIRQLAARKLPELRERAARAADAAQLLRAHASDPDPSALVRPADGTPTLPAGEQLRSSGAGR